ncbi:MAG: hypothetical protein R2856_38325 [Caldilineaceae bacterium]
MRSLSRTSVAIAALMVSVSVIIGVGVMIGSFRLTVEQWLDDVLRRTSLCPRRIWKANRVTNGLDPALVDVLRGFPGIADFSTNREVNVTAQIDGETWRSAWRR